MTTDEAVKEHLLVVQLLQTCLHEIDVGTRLLVQRAQHGQTIFFLGNGGSAAMAQHLAAELSGASIALADPASLTAIGNDRSFDQVFARRIKALGRPGDAVVAMSTSGKSSNVLEAVRVAREVKVLSLALTGMGPNPLSELADYAICVPSRSTARIQEAHLLIGHIWCQRIEEACG